MKKMHLFQLYANSKKLETYDSLRHAVNNCFTTMPALEETPTKIVHSVMYIHEATHEVTHEVMQIYSLKTDKIVNMIKICNHALQQYSNTIKDWHDWVMKSCECEEKATAFIMKELKKQARI